MNNLLRIFLRELYANGPSECPNHDQPNADIRLPLWRSISVYTSNYISHLIIK